MGLVTLQAKVAYILLGLEPGLLLCLLGHRFSLALQLLACS